VSLLHRLVGRVIRSHFERQARRAGVAELADRLDANGRSLAQRLAAQADGDGVRETLRHVVGIERWGQRRLRVALGDAPDPGGHRPYRPSDEASLDALRIAFATTRADTVALARTLARAEPDPDLRIAHDDLGELSVGAWLAYLDGHALIEARRRLR
jgi:hypothetical protein